MANKYGDTTCALSVGPDRTFLFAIMDSRAQNFSFVYTLSVICRERGFWHYAKAMLLKFAILEDDNYNAHQNEDHSCFYQIIFRWNVLVFEVVYGNRIIVCVDLWFHVGCMCICNCTYSVMKNTSLQRNILTWNVIVWIFLYFFIFILFLCLSPFIKSWP